VACFARLLQGRHKDAIGNTPSDQGTHHDVAPTPSTSPTRGSKPSDADTAGNGNRNLNINADAVSTTTDTTAPPGPDVVAVAPSPNEDAATATTTTATATTADPNTASPDADAGADAATADTSGSGAIHDDNAKTVEPSDQRSDIETGVVVTITSCDDVPRGATFQGGVLVVAGPIDCSAKTLKVRAMQHVSVSMVDRVAGIRVRSCSSSSLR